MITRVEKGLKNWLIILLDWIKGQNMDEDITRYRRFKNMVEYITRYIGDIQYLEKIWLNTLQVY